MLTVLAAVLVSALGPAPAEPPSPRSARLDPNPCITALRVGLRCPDLVMRRPHGIYAQARAGRTLLRAGNSIDSIGRGPVELHGVRIGPRFMRASQRIYKRAGGFIGVRTGARLQYKLAHLGQRYWKFYNAARFELWRVDERGRRTRKLRTGPKVSYCLRDLQRTRPNLPRSPAAPRYPACDTYPLRRRVTLGTSIGWSDVYPPAYPEQWIDVSGLRGCFAYVHIADPENRIYEADEDNNEAQVIVRLPYRSYASRRGCRGADDGRPLYPSPY